MDLACCPKCGAEWRGGEMCRQCGFVPIGAGLHKLPKKKKKKHGRYVEPGSARGLIFFIFLGLIAFGSWKTQPWNDDWEMVRAMFGQGRRHSLVGQWEMVKTIAVKKDAPPILVQKGARTGTLDFSKKGAVKIVFADKSGKRVAHGKYVVGGQLVSMSQIQSDSAEMGVPQRVKMQLAWTGPNTVVASCGGTEAIYLRRRNAGHPVASLLRMGLKGGNSDAPGAMRGVIATVQDEVRQEQDN